MLALNTDIGSFDRAALDAHIEAVQVEAARGCGLSDVLYETRVQEGYAQLLAQAPEAHRAETDAVLRARGFDPDVKPYEPREDECSLTGIHVDCCPCGYHP